MDLSTPVSQLNRVGKVLGGRLKVLGLHTAQDLIFYFPFRYEDYSKTRIIRDLQPGEQVTLKGKIETIASKRSPRKRKIITEAVVADGSGRMRVIWFGQPFISKVLRAGDEVYLSGKVTQDAFGVHMVGPSYEKSNTGTTTHTARIVPIYPLTAGITEKQLRFLMSQILPLAREISDWLPPEIQKKVSLISLPNALAQIHFPNSWAEVRQAERRLKFDELFLLQLRAEMIRQEIKRSEAPAIPFQEELIKEFVQSLPFQLTPDQKIAAWEILQDMQKTEPMNRLLEGDVGSGKTVVSALCMYNAALSGSQSVIMAPTEILAGQHFHTLQKVLARFGVRIGLLTRTKAVCSPENPSDFDELSSSLSLRTEGNRVASGDEGSHSKKKKISFAQQKQALLGAVKNGEVQIIIGTHALLSEEFQCKNLGLVIVDEQHRFGVEQRKQLKEKSGGVGPHFLSMTATPIPRTFALTIYGDLDVSIIKAKPLGRKPIITRLVEPHNRQKAYDFIRGQVQAGRQVFVICPLIQEKDHEEIGKQRNREIEIVGDEKKTVMREYEKLSREIFPDLKVGFLHGKMKSKEKDGVMENFVQKRLDILVSTSVVEVGVDIPNASVMMIEGAERFGLAQLHQFRGRVGRSEYQSYCFLFTGSISESVNERLQFFEQTLDGFALAEYDLETRGPGEVYGSTQSGLMNLRLATLKDIDIIRSAREIAKGIDFNKYPQLRQKVEEWEKAVHLE